MKKKPDYLNEMEYIKDWCITIIDFKLAMTETPVEIKSIYEPLKRSLIDNYTSKNKNVQRGFRETYKNMKEEVSYWPNDMIINLNNILYSKFGEIINVDNEIIVKKVIAKGKIGNDDEYRIILEKANEICQSNRKSSKLDELNSLLLIYEQGKK